MVTVEMKSGEIYRGLLVEAEETMNCQLKEVSMTACDGRVVSLENVYVRGGHIKLIVLPEMLKYAPIFKKVQGDKRTRYGNSTEGKSVKRHK